MSYKSEVHMDIEQVEAIHTLKGHSNSVDAVRVDPSNKKRFATGSHDKTIKIWDVKKLKCVTTSEADR